jgi:septal ring factor EnvC (AmiA/AmiB activator)
MMKTDNLESLFKHLEGGFDIESPGEGHDKRFLNKLNRNTAEISSRTNHRALWWPITGIAASVVMLISLFIGFNNNTPDLASISPEMAQTQLFFTNAIAEELAKLESETSPESQKIITDAMTQMDILDQEYEKLKQKLKESGEDERVIHAMISNFQNRIDVLQNVLQQIEDVKQLKNDNYENSATI